MDPAHLDDVDPETKALLLKLMQEEEQEGLDSPGFSSTPPPSIPTRVGFGMSSGPRLSSSVVSELSRAFQLPSDGRPPAPVPMPTGRSSITPDSSGTADSSSSPVSSLISFFNKNSEFSPFGGPPRKGLTARVPALSSETKESTPFDLSQLKDDVGKEEDKDEDAKEDKKKPAPSEFERTFDFRHGEMPAQVECVGPNLDDIARNHVDK